MAPICKLSLVWFILQERTNILFFPIILLVILCGLRRLVDSNDSLTKKVFECQERVHQLENELGRLVDSNDSLTKKVSECQERVHQLKNERSEPEEIAANLSERELYEAPEIGSSSGQTCKLGNLPMMVAGVMSENPQQQTECTTQFRRLLSDDENPPIQQIIEAGVVPRLVQFLQRDYNPDLQLEAAFALANIASRTSEHTAVVIESGSVPIFVRLLSSPHDDVREQAVLALGVIARDSPHCDHVLQSGAMQPLLQQLNQNAKSSMLRHVAWALKRICRGLLWPDFNMVRPVLVRLAQLIFSPDEEVLTNTCCALSYLRSSEYFEPEQRQAVIGAGVCLRLVELLLHPNPDVQRGALRTVEYFFEHYELQSQLILDNSNTLPSILALLSSPDEEILISACEIIYKICEYEDRIQSVIDNNIIPPLIQLLTNGDFDVGTGAVSAISEISSTGTSEQIKFMVQQGCIRPLCDFLADSSNAESYDIALEGIENILKVGQQEMMLTGQPNQMATFIAEAEGLKTIEMLAKHEHNDSMEEDCIRILENFFGVEYRFHLISRNFSPDALRLVLS